MTTCRATGSDSNDYSLIHLRILMCSVMACLLRWIEGGWEHRGKKKWSYGQCALSRSSFSQQVQTNQQQALVVCLGANVLIP